MTRTRILIGRKRATLDLSTGGTFARTSAAYYQTSASALASASSGTRRSADNRGDGMGPCLLMEKSATNQAQRSRELNVAPWNAGGTGYSVTAGDANGPDGSSSTADRIQAPSTYSVYQGPFSPTNGQTWAFSFWARRRTGAGADECHFALQDGPHPGGTAYVNDAITETWGRHSVTRTITASGTVYLVPGEGRTGGGLTARNLDYDVDLIMYEQSWYPTSPVDTAGGSATRAADTLSYSSGSYSTQFLTAGFVVVFAPDASSAEIVSASEDWRLVQVGASDYVRIRNNAGSCVVDLVCGGSVVATKTVTFSRVQALTITAKPSAGSLTVAGATTGNGTNTGAGAAWANASTLYIGGSNTGSNPVTGRFGDARGTALGPCLREAA